MSQDEADSEKQGISEKRCEMCLSYKARYRCPQCNCSTCSLPCCREHKRKYGCEGMSSRTRYVPLDTYDSSVLLSVTSEYFSADTIFWRIEWVFYSASGYTVYSDRIPGSVSIATLLRKLLSGHLNDDVLENREHLVEYISAPKSDIHCVIKVEENYWTNDLRYHLLNTALSLDENLKNKIIVEFPTIYVILTKDLARFPLLTEEGKLQVLQSRIWERSPQERSVEEVFSVMHDIWRKWMQSSQPKLDELEEGEIVDDCKPINDIPLKRMLPLSYRQKQRLRVKSGIKMKLSKRLEKRQMIEQLSTELVKRERQQKLAQCVAEPKTNERSHSSRSQSEAAVDIANPATHSPLPRNSALSKDYFGLAGDISLSSDSDSD
ncbi:unnamed protein product [Soboliphyme baturini]|uniref:HIT-type domain-containing protein n=1 Tax=Soboliphyme baturini TaxID=241478 RepID=A0A183J1T5_9BILA|nr:unnamed protein product [Soboliphyme baturini]